MMAAAFPMYDLINWNAPSRLASSDAEPVSP